MFGKRSADATIVRNGIDVSRFAFDSDARARIREELRIPLDATVLINVARMSEQKNQLRLLSIFHEYLKADASAFLVLVGDGDLRPRIEARIAQLGLERQVLLLGRRANTEEYCSAADVAVFPSLFEGLPVALIEAQANGLPILASDVVTKDADVSGLIEFASLSAPDGVWADDLYALTAQQRMPSERLPYAQRMVEAGYDAKEASKTLRRIYRRLLA